MSYWFSLGIGLLKSGFGGWCSDLLWVRYFPVQSFSGVTSQERLLPIGVVLLLASWHDTLVHGFLTHTTFNILAGESFSFGSLFMLLLYACWSGYITKSSSYSTDLLKFHQDCFDPLGNVFNISKKTCSEKFFKIFFILTIIGGICIK